MGATSATGVGLGSVEGQNAGSKHWTVSVARLLGPRVMAADSVLTDGSGLATVVLPKLSGVVGDYIVLATNATSASVVRGYLTFGANDTTVHIVSGATNTVQWAIVRVGLTT